MMRQLSHILCRLLLVKGSQVYNEILQLKPVISLEIASNSAFQSISNLKINLLSCALAKKN